MSTQRAYRELTKPRLSMLAALSAVAGFFCALPSEPWTGMSLLALSIGTGLAAGACGALNQWMERLPDAQMQRTASRPLPKGQLTPRAALIFGIVLLVGGLAMIARWTNLTALALTAATVVSYLFLYTPLKTRTQWCTVVGSLPGALPVLIGSAARSTDGNPDAMGWALFTILFCWQVPHFMGLAVLWKDDYARGGFRITTVVDPSGESAARQSTFFLVLLLVASAVPVILAPADLRAYGVVAALLGAWYLRLGIAFRDKSRREHVARRFFLFSLLYLSVLLLTLVLDRIF
jgi:protoheme IX farnesyltransferase